MSPARSAAPTTTARSSTSELKTTGAANTSTATAVAAVTPQLVSDPKFVYDVLRDAVASVLEIDPATLDRDTAFADIDADSLVLVEVAEIVEERLAAHAPQPLRIPDAELEQLLTLGQAVDYVQALL